MEYSTFVKLAAEFFGTAILMIFGNGAVANVELKNTKGWRRKKLGPSANHVNPMGPFRRRMCC